MEQQLAEAGKDPEQRSTPFLKEKLSAQNASHKQTTNITHDWVSALLSATALTDQPSFSYTAAPPAAAPHATPEAAAAVAVANHTNTSSKVLIMKGKSLRCISTKWRVYYRPSFKVFELGGSAQGGSGSVSGCSNRDETMRPPPNPAY